jgi:hypothetical protein
MLASKFELCDVETDKQTVRILQDCNLLLAWISTVESKKRGSSEFPE